MDISQAILTLIGTLVGGGIVVASTWQQARLERQKTVRQWYEQTYITEGIDAVVNYLLCFRLHILNKDINGVMRWSGILVFHSTGI